MTTFSKRSGGGENAAFDIELPVSITREAVEALAQRQGKSVLDLLTALQGAAARLDDGEVTLGALSAIKWQILKEQGRVPPGPKFPHVNVQLIGQATCSTSSDSSARHYEKREPRAKTSSPSPTRLKVPAPMLTHSQS